MQTVIWTAVMCFYLAVCSVIWSEAGVTAGFLSFVVGGWFLNTLMK